MNRFGKDYFRFGKWLGYRGNEPIFGFLRTFPAFFIVFGLFVFSLLPYHLPAALAQVAAEPELPRVYIDTTYTPPSGMVHTPLTSQGFQNALNAANCGDIIKLKAGTFYVGNFNLPAKSCSDWIVITTDSTSIPEPETRINPSYSSAMPKLVTPNAAPILTTSPKASNYRFIGVEFTTTSTWDYNLIYLDSLSSNYNDFPQNIIFDRVYIHGRPDSQTRRGIAMNTRSTAVIDSYISEIHQAGFDSQSIASWGGPGPFKIVNNHLEAASENVCFGGAFPYVVGTVPSDIEIRGNYFYKPLSWYVNHPTFTGTQWFVKNLFETKNSRRLLIEGNIFENNWVEEQAGFAIVLTPRSNDSGSVAVNEDITFRNNIVRHSAQGVSILAFDEGATTIQANRILISNNIWEDLYQAKWGGDGRLFQLLSGPKDVIIRNNTGFESGVPLLIDGGYDGNLKTRNLVYENNISQYNTYGITSPIGGGTDAFERNTIDYVYNQNVFILNRYNPNDYYTSPAYLSTFYPEGSFFPTDFSEVGFTNYNNGINGDYTLLSSSPYKNAGTDGKDIGADVAAVNCATRGAVTGIWDGDISLSPTSQTFGATGGSGTVNVTFPAGCNWTGVSSVSWITIISGASGSGDGKVNYSVSANSGTSSRAGTLSIAGKIFTVNQAGLSCTYSISPTEQKFGFAGGKGSVAVTAGSGCAWKAKSTSSGWLFITSGSSGSGSGRVNFYVAPNPSYSSRSAQLVIGGKYFKVTQEGRSCTYTITPNSQFIPATGYSGSVRVSAPSACSWTAVSNADWVVVYSGGSGSGSGMVYYKVGTNSGTSSRTGTLSIAGKTFTVIQAPGDGITGHITGRPSGRPQN